ncbi:hypothetical protein NBRC116494_35870 [Aurantivibrio plasticivorans]
MSKVIELNLHRGEESEKRARISVSLRNVSRDCRREILSSYSYNALWLGQLTLKQYAELLYSHLRIRRHLESLFESLDGTFNVVNLFNLEEKAFDVSQYVTQQRLKSTLLERDIECLAKSHGVRCDVLPEKAAELINYMNRVHEVYSVALLGVLYMLEESIIYAGPRIGKALDKHLSLHSEATSYLDGHDNQKQTLWEFRKSLDLISDFQTQANIVIAATLSYRIYQDLLDPKASRLRHSRAVH